jgi:hypothetical protein
MEIFVQRKHIEAGHKHSCRSCPVALALLEICGDKIRNVDADYETIWITPRDAPGSAQETQFDTPDRAERFMRNFDERRAGRRPFRFVLPGLADLLSAVSSES